jgi:hypothetical protein
VLADGDGILVLANRRMEEIFGSLAERIHARSRQYPAPGGTFAGPSIGCDLDAIERDRSGRGPRPSARARGPASCLRAPIAQFRTRAQAHGPPLPGI